MSSREERAPPRRTHTRSASISFAALSSSNYETTRAIPADIHDTSMDEMASRLLDDSNLSQFQVHSSRRLSQHSISNVLHNLLDNLPEASQVRRDLPQLPQLEFNNDEAWHLQFRSIAVGESALNSAGNVVAMPLDETHRNQASVARHHSHKKIASGPGSNRITSRERHRRRITAKAAEAGRVREYREENRAKTLDIISSPLQPNQHPRDREIGLAVSMPLQESSRPVQPPRNDAELSIASIPNPDQSMFARKRLDVTSKINAMLAATVELKGQPSSNVLLHNPLPPSKKKFRGRQILARVKHAFRRHDQSKQKQYDTARDQSVLYQTFSREKDEYDPARSPISSVESRVNEGLNLNNPKVRSITGHGNVVRKPLPDDGRSLRSRKSLEDRLASNQASAISRNLEQSPPQISQLAASSSRSPQLPIISVHPPPVSRVTNFSRPSATGFSSPPPKGSFGFDELLSSSPDDKSTPSHRRYKLESSRREDGTRGRLMTIPKSKPSLLDTEQSAIKPENLTAELDELDHTLLVPARYKVKKHPSPSKSELENLGLGLSSLHTIVRASPRGAFPPPTRPLPPTPLRNRDANSAMTTHALPPRVESRGMMRGECSEQSQLRSPINDHRLAYQSPSPPLIPPPRLPPLIPPPSRIPRSPMNPRSLIGAKSLIQATTRRSPMVPRSPTQRVTRRPPGSRTPMAGCASPSLQVEDSSIDELQWTKTHMLLACDATNSCTNP